jgi:hypothetical protein
MERIDSNSMNVYRYFLTGEKIIDSLLAKKYDYFTSFRSGDSATHQINDTLPIVCFGSSRPGKQVFGNGLVGNYYTFVSGLGLYHEAFCEFGGSTETLNGCIINGIQYGQIVGVERNENGLPIDFSLSQNYPNPFNPVTKIKFAIPTPLNPPEGGTQEVRLVIYDVLGRNVATLVNEGLKPGTYEAEWDGTNYSSGVYFYTLITGDFIETKKMVLVK